MTFAFLDPWEDISITRRRLPHWEQDGKTYFITFRTIDSMPERVVAAWRDERDRWLGKHGINPTDEEWHSELGKLPGSVRYEFHSVFSERFHEFLDDCHGECLLRQPELAAIVARGLLHFDGDRYEMGDFVVMPNHVHLLVQFLAPDQLKKQGRSWKKYMAVEINKSLGRRGHFWQGESYDHLVRGPEEFLHYREYIASNPLKAKLKSGEYWHYQSTKAPT